MTTQELIDRVNDLLCADLDNYKGEAATPAQVVEQLNWGLRVIGKACYLIDPLITFTATVGSMGPYRLDELSVFSKRIISLHKVIVNGRALLGPDGRPGCWNFSEFEETYPDWRNASAGTPQFAVLLGDTVMLCPAPDPLPTSLKACGQIIPDDLSSSTPTTLAARPQLPIDAHDPLALMTAAIAARPVATEAEAWQRLNDYRAEAASIVRGIGMRNFNAIHNSTRAIGRSTRYIGV